MSGSNDVDAVAWYNGDANNPSDGTKAVGTKQVNELGIYDMSGNIWEWVFDANGYYRMIRGGSWDASPSERCSVNFREGKAYPDDRGYNRFGFRVARNAKSNMITVQGGTLPQGSGLAGQVVGDFQIARYEVTWGEWKTVRDWAVANGYPDLANVGAGRGHDHPVQSVSWYDAVKWCNAKSEMEGLVPVYSSSGSIYRTGEFGWAGSSVVQVRAVADGYRLPLEIEWEWAARGGLSSQSYIYSGSNNLSSVAWYSINSENSTNSVGLKTANELSLHDMSGNVWEWCWDLAGQLRRLRGGGWTDDANRFSIADRGIDYMNPDSRNSDFGFRLARNAPSTHFTDTFVTGNNTFNLEFVSIGNPMNAADPATNLGSVAYPYRISKYSISQKVWDAAVANGLQNVESNTRHDAIGLIAGENTPTNNVSWYEAAAFVNWLNTSKGYQPAYNLTFSNGEWSMQLWSTENSWSEGGLNRYRHKNAHYFLPSDNEWYKAAYYDPNKPGGAGYWLYTTGSDNPPEQVSNTSTGKGGATWNYGGAGTDPGTTVFWLASWSAPADVNACGGLSPYGTMGQGGNAAQWVETSSNGLNEDPQAGRRAMGYSYSWWGTVSAREDNGLNNLQPQLDVGGTVGIRVGSVED